MYGVNFNLANIKLPTFGPLKNYFINSEKIIFTFEENKFEKIILNIYLISPEGIKTSLASISNNTYIYSIDKNLSTEELQNFYESTIQIVVQGTSSLYTKTKTFNLQVSNLDACTLPNSELLCSPTTLCNG